MSAVRDDGGALSLLPSVITAPAGRLGAAAQNAFEVARFGGLVTDEVRSPFVVVGEDRVHRLRHYYAEPNGRRVDRDALSAPVLLVPPMMLATDVYDVAPRMSAVTMLHEAGIDPWVVDFGLPDEEIGGLERTLADHIIAVSAAVDRVRELTGEDPHLGGYSQGGMFAYQVAAYRRSEGIASLFTFGASVDNRQGMPFGAPAGAAAKLAELVADHVLPGRKIPAWATRNAFQLLNPVRAVQTRLAFIRQLHDREALLAREGQRRFLEVDGWVAWPGPAAVDFLRQFVVNNRMLEGGFVVEDRLLTLADVRLPIMSVVGTVDQIAPIPGVRAIGAAAPSAEVYELAIQAGHFGLVVGTLAKRLTWPTVARWVHWRDGDPSAADAPPEGLDPLLVDGVSESLDGQVRDRVDYGLELAGGVGSGIVRSVAGTAGRTVRGAVGLTREAASQLPRLARLQGMGPSTQISLGRLLEERRAHNADEVVFLFGDRAHTAGAMNTRIDNVVRGLISVGVRQGEHVGVLMGARPSALTLTAALSRLGAVAVMLRPDGDLAREVRLGQVRRIVSDPERAAQASEVDGVETFVLGGGAGPRELGVSLTRDMEQIDVARVRLPRWYAPNPGRAGELAFIVFAGEDDALRMSRITNAAWVTSALGTASSAALSAADTVYAVAPIYHASTLMMSVGGAIAGGGRLAMGSEYQPEAFWDEVRRYGATVASYTWTLMHDLVEGPPHPGERHHPIRLFIGSGMPRGLWRRVQQRFAPARVLEFYASTETGAILVNLRGSKLGAMGRPLPGTPPVRLAAYHPTSGQLVLGNDGFVRASSTGEVGVLLAQARALDSIATTPLRGVFAADDAWLSTGDLFRSDRDGDYWRLGAARDLLLTARGAVYPGAVRNALEDLPEVDLAVVYGLEPTPGAGELAVAAVTLREDRQLTPRGLAGALRNLPAGVAPDLVCVVEEIPATTWYRPMTAPLKARGLPSVGTGAAPAWYLDRGGERYRPLTESARRRLAGGGA